MSVKAVTWALEQEIADPVSHLLLVNLANHANEDHVCWPGQQLLADRIGRSKDTVQRHLRKLEKSHHIKSSFRADENGHRTSNLYTLNVVVTVGVTPKPSDVPRSPKPHGRSVGDKGLNRKTAPPKPQTPPLLNRTLHAAGTHNHHIESKRKTFDHDLKREVKSPVTGPTPTHIATARRQRGDAVVDAALDAIKTQKFKIQRDADRAFTQSVANTVLRNRMPPEPIQTDIEQLIAEKVA